MTATADAPLRIAYIITHYPSPSHTFIYGEIQALGDLGVEVSPISINPIPPEELLSDADRQEAQRTYYVKSLPRAVVFKQCLGFALRNPGSVWRTSRMAMGASRWDLHALVWHLFHVIEAIVVVRRSQSVGAKHIHSHFGGVPSTIAMYASELSVNKGVRQLSWSATIHGYHEFVNERNTLLSSKVQRASFVACVSDYTRSQLMRIVGDPELWPNIHVLRCGIDLAAFGFAPGAVGRPVRIMVTARVVAEKGLGVLLDAVAQLRRDGLETEVTIIGDGPARSELSAYGNELGLIGHVSWLGLQPPTEVRAWLRKTDIFCLPSFAEGLPVVIMEAMATGVPVVTTYLGGIPELVESGVTGLVVPAARSDLLADALRSLSTESSTRTEIIKAARARVEQMHDVQRSAATLRELFRTALRS